MVNNELFTAFGRDWKAGKYNLLHPESYEYIELWKEQFRYCREGITIGGKYMSGRLYFYSNFCTIQLMGDEGAKTNSRRKIAGTPNLRDVEWEVFKNVELCLQAKKNFMWISGRRGGKSFIASSLVAYNFIFFKSSSGVIGAGDAEKGKDLMTKVVFHLQNLSDTEFFIPMLTETWKHIQSGWEEKDPHNKNTFVKKCNDRNIYNITFKNRPTAANGKTADIFIFEEVGMFDNLIASFNASKPCWQEGGENFGMAFMCGTGGDMKKGSIDAQKMFNDPDTYDILSFKNDDGKEIGYFLPATKVLNQFKDDNGNTNIEAAKVFLETERHKLEKARDLGALYNYIQYYPFTSDEAFLAASSTIFPVALLQQQIKFLLLNQVAPYVPERGWMRLVSGTVVFDTDKYAREVDFPASSNNIQGCVCIYEHPESINGEIPLHLYIAGTDPYAQDMATSSDSLGSTFIFKRFHNADRSHNIIVAEFTGRSTTADDYHEQLRLLLMYYKAKTLYENNIPGLKQYFETKNCLNLLHSQPEILKDIQLTSVVERKYGLHMTESIKTFMLNQIKTWLLQEIDEGVYNLNRIYSINLLKEMMSYNEDDNFDRVIAFGMVIIQDLEFHRNKVVEVDDKIAGFFSPYFSKSERLVKYIQKNYNI